MNFLRGFTIFTCLTVATIQARGSTRPDNYDDAEEELNCNYKVLLEAIKEVKEQVTEEKNEISILRTENMKLSEYIIEEKKRTAIFQNKNIELNQKIQELVELLAQNGTRDIFDASEKDSITAVKYWYSIDPSSIQGKNGNYHNYTPLHYASLNGNLAIVEFLLSKGVDADAESSYNERPLMWASNRGHVPVVKALLDKGAGINRQDQVKDTPLHYAVWRDKLPVVELLIERGADKSLRNNENQTPLDLARKEGKKSIVDYLSSL